MRTRFAGEAYDLACRCHERVRMILSRLFIRVSENRNGNDRVADRLISPPGSLLVEGCGKIFRHSADVIRPTEISLPLPLNSCPSPAEKSSLGFVCDMTSAGEKSLPISYANRVAENSCALQVDWLTRGCGKIFPGSATRPEAAENSFRLKPPCTCLFSRFLSLILTFRFPDKIN
jgi:hypothetical protein